MKQEFKAGILEFGERLLPKPPDPTFQEPGGRQASPFLQGVDPGCTRPLPLRSPLSPGISAGYPDIQGLSFITAKAQSVQTGHVAGLILPEATSPALCSLPVGGKSREGLSPNPHLPVSPGSAH